MSNLISAAISSQGRQRPGKTKISNLEEAAAATMGDLLYSRDEKIALSAAKEILSLNQRYDEHETSKQQQSDINKSLAPAAIAAAVSGLAALGELLLNRNPDEATEMKQAEKPLNIIDPNELSAIVADNIVVDISLPTIETESVIEPEPILEPAIKPKSVISNPTISNPKIIESLKGTKNRHAK